MIAFLEGTIKIRSVKFIVLNVNGVGYKVFVSPDTLRKNAANISLWTHLQVREDSMELYGFESYQELEFFEMLIQVSGVGPKSALGILSMAPLDTLKKSIASGEISYLTKASGIGKKTAEKLVIELRDKVGTLDENMKNIFREEQDVVDALKSLGYSLSEATNAIKQVPPETQGANNRIKEALKALGK